MHAKNNDFFEKHSLVFLETGIKMTISTSFENFSKKKDAINLGLDTWKDQF